MSDHSYDLDERRTNEAIAHGNAELSQKKGEYTKLETDIKTWENDLKIGKPKLETLKREIQTLESNQHHRIQQQLTKAQQHSKEFAEIKKGGGKLDEKPKSHSFL